MDRLVERWQALEVDSPTVAIFLPVVVLGLTVVYTLISYSRDRPPSRRKSNAVEGGWLGGECIVLLLCGVYFVRGRGGVGRKVPFANLNTDTTVSSLSPALRP